MADKYLDSNSIKLLLRELEPAPIPDYNISKLFEVNVEPVYRTEEPYDISGYAGYTDDTGLISVFGAFIYVNGRAAHITWTPDSGYNMRYGILGWNHAYFTTTQETVSGGFSNLKIFNKDYPNGTCSFQADILGATIVMGPISLNYIDPGTK